MNRLVVASGVLVLEAASHAIFSGTNSTPGIWNIVLPGLVGAAPAICRAANECFRFLTECGSGPTA